MAKSKQLRKQTSPARPSSRVWPTILVLAIPALVLALSAASYLPFISDDALISLRYAQRLLDGDGLTWTAGERVEGYSNLLWILSNALLGAVGFDLILAARILGFAGCLAAIAALAWAYPPRSATGPAPALLGGLMLALSGTVGVWTVGGLEQPLLIGLLAWTIATAYALLARQGEPAASPWPTAVLLACVCLTRPDGILFTVGIVTGLVIARGRDNGNNTGIGRLVARLITPSVVAVTLQLVFRLTYYGAWLPNTAGAKLSFGSRRLMEGASYVGFGALWLAALLLPTVALAIAARPMSRTSGRLVFLLPSFVLWTGYVIAIGGDYFPARRHLAPLVVLLVFALAEALDGLRARDVAWYRRALGATALGVLLFCAMQHFDPENRRARLERWEWDGEVIGDVLRRGFPEKPLMAVDPAGTLPYFSKLPAIDMLGLNDRYLATHRPDDFGTGDLGHELGDGAYILDREPDLVVFCGPGGGQTPCFRSGKEMVEDPRFLEQYMPVTFQGTGTRQTGPFESGDTYLFRSLIWVRREGGRIGIRREADRIVIPAYLMMRIGQPVAKLDGPGQFVVAVGGQNPAGVDRVPLPAGKWNLTVEAEGPPLRTMVRMSDSEQMLGGGYGGTSFVVAGEPGSLWPVDVLTLPPGPEGETLVRNLVFTRVD